MHRPNKNSICTRWYVGENSKLKLRERHRRRQRRWWWWTHALYPCPLFVSKHTLIKSHKQMHTRFPLALQFSSNGKLCDNFNEFFSPADLLNCFLLSLSLSISQSFSQFVSLCSMMVRISFPFFFNDLPRNFLVFFSIIFFELKSKVNVNWTGFKILNWIGRSKKKMQTWIEVWARMWLLHTLHLLLLTDCVCALSLPAENWHNIGIGRNVINIYVYKYKYTYKTDDIVITMNINRSRKTQQQQ